MSLHVLARQGLTYGVAGSLALLLDWGCFVGLSWLGLDTVPANLLARSSGAGIAYLLNGMVTFRDTQGSRLGWRRLGRFVAAWTMLTAASTLAMSNINAYAGLQLTWLAKPVVEVCLAAISFLLYRHWIYK